MTNSFVFAAIVGLSLSPVALASPAAESSQTRGIAYKSATDVAIAMTDELSRIFKPVLNGATKESATTLASEIKAYLPKIQQYGKAIKSFPKPKVEELKGLAKKIYAMNKAMKPFVDELASTNKMNAEVRTMVEASVKELRNAMEAIDPIMQDYFPDEKMNPLMAEFEKKLPESGE